MKNWHTLTLEYVIFLLALIFTAFHITLNLAIISPLFSEHLIAYAALVTILMGTLFLIQGRAFRSILFKTTSLLLYWNAPLIIVILLILAIFGAGFSIDLIDISIAIVFGLLFSHIQAFIFTVIVSLLNHNIMQRNWLIITGSMLIFGVLMITPTLLYTTMLLQPIFIFSALILIFPWQIKHILPILAS